jgi:alpha-beta hydrolase superfamily lysophospholipase
MKTSRIRTSDGLALHTVNWLPQGEPKAVVVIVHGVSEHSGRKSEGESVYFKSFDLPINDLKHYVDQIMAANPGKKIFLYGHSMGSLISTMFVLKHQDLLAGFISSGSPLGLDTTATAPLRFIGSILAKIAPKLHFLPMDVNTVCANPETVKAYTEDPLVNHDRLRTSVAFGIMTNGIAARKRTGEIKIPLLMVHGSDDTLTPLAGSRMLNEQAGSADKTLKVYPGMYHEVHNEKDWKTVLNDIVTWLDKHL